MKKLTELLTNLSPNEFEKFKDFINSPYFNKRKDVIRFTEYLAKDYRNVNTDKKNIYGFVYGKENYSMQVTVNLVSRTIILLKKFYSQAGIEKDSTAITNALAIELKRKGLNKLSKQAIEKGINELNKENYTPEYLMKHYQYIENMDSYITGFRNYKEKTENAYLKGELAVNLYILNLLRIANDYVVYKYVNSVTEDPKIFNGFFGLFDFDKYLENLKSINSPYYGLTAVFYYGLMSKQNDQDESYRTRLKQAVFENLDKMRYQDKATCWTMLFAAYVFSGTPTKRKISPEIHEINKYFVERDILTKDELGYIMENNYHNIAYQAINSGNFEWAENFLKKYKDNLPPEAGDNTYYISMARCCFEKGDYKRCLEFISRYKIHNPLERCNTSVIYIKCYFELGFFEEAGYAAEAFRSFLMLNKQLTQRIKKPFIEFLKYLKIILNAVSNKANMKKEHIIKASGSVEINSGSWINSKINLLQEK